VEIVGARFGDDVDDAAGGAAIFGVGATGHNLKFFHRVESDVYGGALATHLFAKETVVVITAIEADVVENAALAVDVDFISIGTLRNAYARSEGEQVFKFAAEDRSRGNRGFVQRRAGFGLSEFDNWHVGDNDLSGDRRNFDGDGNRKILSDS